MENSAPIDIVDGKRRDNEDIRHVVSKDETLAGIALQYGISLPNLKRANRLTGDTIYPGQDLLVPAIQSHNHISPISASLSSPPWELIEPAEIFQCPAQALFEAPQTSQRLVVQGTLSLNDARIVFVPSPTDPSVVRFGSFPFQLDLKIEDVHDSQVLEGTEGEDHYLQISSSEDGKKARITYFLMNETTAVDVQQRIRQQQLDLSATRPALKPEPQLEVPPALEEESTIISEEDFHQLRKELPERFRNNDWRLLYRPSQHGWSLQTFYNRVRNNTSAVLLVQDESRQVFGAFTSEQWHSAKSYYGTGETFVFRFTPQLEVFKWAKENNFFILSDDSSIALGGGGTFALWIDADFDHGASNASSTFGNPPLTSQQFRTLHLEVWGVAAL